MSDEGLQPAVLFLLVGLTVVVLGGLLFVLKDLPAQHSVRRTGRRGVRRLGRPVTGNRVVTSFSCRAVLCDRLVERIEQLSLRRKKLT